MVLGERLKDSLTKSPLAYSAATKHNSNAHE